MVVANRMTELIQTISKKQLTPGTKNIVLDVCVNDKEGEDIDVPYVVLQLE